MMIKTYRSFYGKVDQTLILTILILTLFTLPGQPAHLTLAQQAGAQPITGIVLLQGRTDHSDTTLFLTEEPCSVAIRAAGEIIPGVSVAVTDDAGHFEIRPTIGRTYHCLQAFQHGYLIGQKELPRGE